MKKLASLILGILPLSVMAQLSTSVPFLSIAPDARSVAMGEAGVATSPDINALYWNAAKYAFIRDTAGVSVSYAPWMRGLEDGMNFGTLNAFYRFGGKHAIALGGRFFTYGKIEMLDAEGMPAGSEKPKDFSIDLAYSYRFNRSWSAAVTLHYIQSDAMAGVADAASAFAVDLSAYFNRETTLLGKPVVWNAGLSIANLGTKPSYGDGLDNNYLPASLRLGGSAVVAVCSKHDIGLTVEAGKYLVPGMAVNADGIRYMPDKSVFGGIGDSFSQGFKSVFWSFGGEYTYNRWLKVRAGYHWQHRDFGDRKYFTCGAGAEYAGVLLDFAYRLPSGSDSPFHNSWGLTLGYRF